jgi:hypothetical protein
LKQFLLVYRRSTGRLINCHELDTDLEAALRERVESERAQRRDPDVEVVVLSAPSLDALKRTHRRYFQDLSGLAENLTSAFKAS